MNELWTDRWLMAYGSAATIGTKGVSDIANIDIAIISPMIAPPAELLNYLLIGFLGAAGGLVLKCVWYLLKKKFPALKKIDRKEKE